MSRHVCVTVVLCSLAISNAAYSQGTVVVGGLNNPRGLAFGHDGALYVAEAGLGGSGPCISFSGTSQCFGLSGSITRINLKTGNSKRIATGLPSVAVFGVPGFPPGSVAIGPSDISFSDGEDEAFLSIGSGLKGSDRTAIYDTAASGLGNLVQLHESDRWRFSADLAVSNPNEDNNPNAVLAVDDKEIVVDSGGNSLLEVRSNGAVRTLTKFPSLVINGSTVDSVPTCIVMGPDGNYYVGELTGLAPGQADGQQAPGAARVYRVSPHGGAPEVFRDGFTGIIDIAFLPDGSLCVLEIFNGDIVRVARDGTRSIVTAGLFAPGGMTAGPHGDLYVTNFGIFPGFGEVRRIMP